MEYKEGNNDDRLSQHGFVAIHDGTVKWKFSFILFSWYSFKINPVNGGKKTRFVHTEFGPCALSKLEKGFTINWDKVVGALGQDRASNFRNDVIRMAKTQSKAHPSAFSKFN